MKTKKVRISIGNEYIDITTQFDEDKISDDGLIAGDAFFTAYEKGLIKIVIQDVDNEEHPVNLRGIH